MGAAFVGTEKGDIYYSLDALIPSTLAQKETWTSGDTIDGKEGNDILNIQTGIAMGSPVLNLTSIETVNVNSTTTVALNGSAWDGTNTLNVTKATAATLTAAATTDVNVSGVTGAVAVDGGENVNVTVAATGTSTTIGATTGAAGTVTVTDAALGAAEIKVDGGTDVTITATGSTKTGVDTTGNISVGQTLANDLPTGAVTVSSTGVYADANVTMGAIKIDGGSTVTVTQSAGITAAQTTAALTDTTNSKVIQGAISVDAGAATTTVNVKQDATVAAGAATLAVAGSTQTQTVTFNNLVAGNTVTVNGLTFTAAKDLSAAEVAAAFANLTSGDTQSNTGITTNGSYTGSNTAGFTTGVVVGNTVVYSQTVNGAVGLVAAPATAKGTGVTTPTAPTIATTTTGATTTPGVDGNIGVDAAVVTIADGKATDTIKTVTIDAYASTSSVTSDALTELTLKNANVDAVLTVTNTVASSSLTLNVDNITSDATPLTEIDLDGSVGKITTLTINATGSDSEFILTGAGIKDLTINATADLDISNTAAYATAALKTVDVNGAGSVNLGDLTGSVLNTFDASGNTGGVTAEIDTLTASVGTITEYVFSAGNDVVTLAETTVNTKVTLGAGDDIVTLADGTTALAAVIDGGTGSDTLAMAVANANAVTLAGTSAFENKISGFEKLSLTSTSTTAAAIDLSLFDDIDYVISAGTGAAGTLLLDKMANNGTLELTGATDATGDVTVTMADASGNTDTFNIVTKVDAGDIAFAGDVVVAGVETININAIDLSTDVDNADVINDASLILTANLAKTVNVTGSSDVTLALTGSTLVTLINATNLTGALTATTAVSTSAATIKGGSGADHLTADTTNDVLIGNAGADTLIVANGANLVTLKGGEGIDTYVIGLATNSNGYAIIDGTKAELSGDVIQFAAAIDTMSSLAKISNLGSTAVYQDYVNEAAKSTTADHKVAWFQLEGNTYVVQNNSTLGSFANGVDAVVKITGLVDLTFNDTTNVLEIA